jgi:hypothetical protein
MVIASANAAIAADNLSEKIMKHNPGMTGEGATVTPTAKPTDSSTSEKQMKDAPGVQSQTGSTADPTAKPANISITEKQSKDATKAN